MAKQSKPLTFSFYVGGERVERLSPEQSKRIAERLAETMSVYYTAHPEEYADFKPQVKDVIKQEALTKCNCIV